MAQIPLSGSNDMNLAETSGGGGVTGGSTTCSRFRETLEQQLISRQQKNQDICQWLQKLELGVGGSDSPQSIGGSGGNSDLGYYPAANVMQQNHYQQQQQ